MANKVTLKRSSVAGKIPQTSDLDFGEVALNFTDGRLYFRNSNDQIEFFETPSDSSSEASAFDVLKDDLNLGSVTGTVTQVLDLGSITESANDSYDLGNIVVNGIIFPNTFVLPSSTVSGLPTEGFAGEMRFVTDDATGAIPAFYDGSNWRRLSNNQIVATN